VPSTTVARAIGALVLAVYEGGRLVHVGKVGTGYTESTARKLWAELDKIKRPTSPFADKLPRIATNGVRWVEPKLVAEVELRGWSSDRLIRHGSFQGPARGQEARGGRARERPAGQASCGSRSAAGFCAHAS
jgi:bifunctional non-homologous end joining protein LigD